MESTQVKAFLPPPLDFPVVSTAFWTPFLLSPVPAISIEPTRTIRFDWRRPLLTPRYHPIDFHSVRENIDEYRITDSFVNVRQQTERLIPFAGIFLSHAGEQGLKMIMRFL